MKQRMIELIKYVPILCCMILAVFLILSGDEISVDSILHYAPENLLLAAGFMLLLYVFKSLSVFFPLMVLKLAVGFLFPPLTAIVVNILGMFVSLTVSYCVGRVSGTKLTEKLCGKYPKLRELMQRSAEKQTAKAFFLRIVYILPLDVVSMYLGAARMPYPKYLAASLWGVLPSTIAATLLGASITDPASPMFWISIGMTVGFSVVSLLAYKLWERKQ